MDAPCMNKRPHLFLTGGKGIGKSTLLQKLLVGRRACGFRTVKAVEVYLGRTSLHLLRLDRQERPTEENFLCFCPPVPGGKTAEAFDRLGCEALAPEEAGEVLVMDELGAAEAGAEAFRTAILQALEGDIPILGVLQKADTELFHLVAEHPRVRLVEVRKENRDLLF